MGMLGVGPHQTWMVAVASNGRSRHRSGLAFTRFCTTATESACSQTPQSAPTASSAVCRNCWSSRTLCFLSLAAALWSFAGGASNRPRFRPRQSPVNNACNSPCAASGSKLMLASPTASQRSPAQGTNTELWAAIKPPAAGANWLSARTAVISRALAAVSLSHRR